MAYLHAKNIVHFDLKSANLLLGYRDRRAICKVADFGLSKQKRDTYVSNVTSQRGTLPWIAPEIIKTPESVTERVRGRAAARSARACRGVRQPLCFALLWLCRGVSFGERPGQVGRAAAFGYDTCACGALGKHTCREA